MPDEAEQPVNSGTVARRLARALDERQTEYAHDQFVKIGGVADPRMAQWDEPLNESTP